MAEFLPFEKPNIYKNTRQNYTSNYRFLWHSDKIIKHMFMSMITPPTAPRTMVVNEGK